MTRLGRDVYRLCLITDDRLAGGRSMLDIVAAAVVGGVTMVQIRDKTSATRDFIMAASALATLLRPLAIPLIVNDRVDVALAVGADGIHVGQDDMPVDIVRRLVGPAMLIGLSITCEADLARPDALSADYLGIGPIFAQFTKPDAAAALGLAGLTRLREQTRKPVLAIGGIAAANAAEVVRAGADGVAVVSALVAAADPSAAARRLSGAVGAALRESDRGAAQ